MRNVANRSTSLNRLTLERNQVWIYVVGILGDLMVGSGWTDIDQFFETLLRPTLMLLLYATFLQVPRLHLREAFHDRQLAGVSREVS
jgi:ACR3 family arsenite transporter